MKYFVTSLNMDRERFSGLWLLCILNGDRHYNIFVREKIYGYAIVVPRAIRSQPTTMSKNKYNILVVCAANICRSPMAQGCLNQLLIDRGLEDLIMVDSAGTHVFKSGHKPDRRAQQVAEKYGASLKGCRARAVSAADFSLFDYVLAMDREVLGNLQAICPEDQLEKLLLIMEFVPSLGIEEVPDPYFGNLAGFEHVWSLLDHACRGLLDKICIQHHLSTQWVTNK